MQKYFKYKYKYFWEKVFKMQVRNTIHPCIYNSILNTCFLNTPHHCLVCMPLF